MPHFDARIPEHRENTGAFDVYVGGKTFDLAVAFDTEDGWVEAYVKEHRIDKATGKPVWLLSLDRNKRTIVQRFYLDFVVKDQIGITLWKSKSQRPVVTGT